MTQDRRDTVAPSPQQPTQETWYAKCVDIVLRAGRNMTADSPLPQQPTPRYPSAATAAKMAYWSKDSPQQPTQEALSEALDYLDFPEVPWDKIKDALLPETRNQIIALATLLDRFAAQRVTEAVARVERRNAQQSAQIERLQATIGEYQNRTSERPNDDLTAATDKARREAHAVIEMWDPYSDRWDDIPYDAPTIKALMLRALTPQNPGDAAPHQEGVEDG